MELSKLIRARVGRLDLKRLLCLREKQKALLRVNVMQHKRAPMLKASRMEKQGAAQGWSEKASAQNRKQKAGSNPKSSKGVSLNLERKLGEQGHTSAQPPSPYRMEGSNECMNEGEPQ